jgi:hypothetical protein
MRFPPAKDSVRRHLEPAHQRLCSDASASKHASPGTCSILHASVQFQTRRFYVWLMLHRKLERVHNSLLHAQFPFMLMNNAPLPS